jgi:hypothetical protein
MSEMSTRDRLCVYCGAISRYNGDMLDTHRRMKAHDAVCEQNPLLRRAVSAEARITALERRVASEEAQNARLIATIDAAHRQMDTMTAEYHRNLLAEAETSGRALDERGAAILREEQTNRDLVTLRRLSAAFVMKVKAAFASDSMRGIHAIAAAHGMGYTGPVFADELAALEEALGFEPSGTQTE